jgi:class 3 adenylate cyclase/alpha-beta hydrolase superfamily lysophospholipase
MEPQIRYCTTSDGASIAYATMGAGPVVIMPPSLYSFSGRLRVLPWARAFCAAISATFTLVLYDSRGMGLSGRERREYGIDARFLDLDAVVRAVGAEAFALYGIGSSGLTAMAYTARHPERIASLVVADSYARGEQFYRENPLGQILDALGIVTAEQWPVVTDMLGARIVTDDADPAAARSIGALIRETWDPDAFMAYRQANREIDTSAELAAIAVPTLIVATSADQASFEQSRELATAIPNARLVRVTPHWAGWDERDYATLVSFLTEHAPPAEAAAAPATSAPAAPSGMAVILFTDIVDSTALTERLGDTVFRDASRSLDASLRAAIREAGGAAIDGKLLGDGVLATFTSAAQAIDGAQRCLALSAASELGLHLGLHAGDVIREDNNVYGGAVNIASRISGLSAPGEVLVSRTVADLARTSAGVAFEDRGERPLKGVADPVRVFAVRRGMA